jgi:hypothetical protein
MNKIYSKSELEQMSTLGIYLLMQEQGADMLGLWSAEKNDLISAYCQQIGSNKCS